MISAFLLRGEDFTLSLLNSREKLQTQVELHGLGDLFQPRGFCDSQAICDRC